MKAFVTGGLGQIGSHVIEMLLARGDEVVTVDNLATGRPEHLPAHPRLRVVIDSIAKKELVEKLVAEQRPDVIVHAAASYKEPRRLGQRHPDQLRRGSQHRRLGQAS